METSLENRKIEIEQETLNHLNTTRKWTMFLAIIGFIFLGLFIAIGVITGTFLSVFKPGETSIGISETLMYVIFFAFAVIYLFPVLFLFRFSKHTAKAVLTLDIHELHKAFKNLKSFFIYLGVLIIIALTFYVWALIAAGTSMTFIKNLG